MAYPEAIKRRALELSKGRSAAHVLKILEQEFKEQYMPDERTIRRWRKEKPMAPEAQKRIELEWLLMESMKEHFEHLTDVARTLLANGLDTVEPKRSKGDEFEPAEYIVWDGYFEKATVNQDQLSDMLDDNIPLAASKHGLDFDCFLSHLEVEYSDIESKGLWKVIRENPYELIETLRVLARRKTFKGTCPVCENWQ